VTTETITDYETVERTTEVTVCDLCGCDEDDTPEMVTVTGNFHICAACVVEYDGTADNYDTINVTESISGINYIKPQPSSLSAVRERLTPAWWGEWREQKTDIVDLFIGFTTILCLVVSVGLFVLGVTSLF